MRTDPAMAGSGRGVTARAPDRRRFLAMGAGVGVGGLVTGGAGLTGARRASARGPRTADWEALRVRLSSHALFRPGQRGYNAARELFDPRFDVLTPAGVAYCRTAQDVSACVNFARTFRLPVRRPQLRGLVERQPRPDRGHLADELVRGRQRPGR